MMPVSYGDSMKLKASIERVLSYPKVKVFVFELRPKSELLIEKEIYYGLASDNAWLKKTIKWAIANHKSIEIVNLLDDVK